MDWTEEEENALLSYLRVKTNNERFLKRNAEREKAFGDCAVFLSKRSGRRRHFKAKDVKNFCIYLVEKRYRLDHSNLPHLFRVGIFEKKDGKPCDIFTREECRKFAQEDEALEEEVPIPEETTALLLRTSESVDSVTRRGARYKSGSSEIDDANTVREHIRKRHKSRHTTSHDECQSQFDPKEQKETVYLPAGSNHLVYKAQHMDGANLRQKFAELEQHIMIAADSLVYRNKSKTSLNRAHRYGLDDYRLLKSIPMVSIIQSCGSGAHYQIARAMIGRAVFQWVFEDGIADSEAYENSSREAAEAVWAVKCEQYDMRMFNPLSAILKDAYFWQTTQATFLDLLLPKKSRELSSHLSTLLGTLFKIEVPRCYIKHDSEQARQKDCNLWSCRVEAIFFQALNLHVKLRQRDHKTVFRWPAFNDRFNEAIMQHEGGNVGCQVSSFVVQSTYMPAVIDQQDSQNPAAVEGGVWYKAVVRVASAPEAATPVLATNQDSSLVKM